MSSMIFSLLKHVSYNVGNKLAARQNVLRGAHCARITIIFLSPLQAAQAIADLIWQHSAWDAASVILHRCAAQLPACKAQLPSQLESSLSSLEKPMPVQTPQVALPNPHVPVSPLVMSQDGLCMTPASTCKQGKSYALLKC